MEWKSISNRQLTVRLKGKQVSMTLFQCYAPTNDADEEVTNAFYEQLQHKLDNTPDHDNIYIQYIIDQCTKWQRQLYMYINLIDFEKKPSTLFIGTVSG